MIREHGRWERKMRFPVLLGMSAIMLATLPMAQARVTKIEIMRSEFANLRGPVIWGCWSI